MSRKTLSKDVEKRILEYLGAQDWPVTTEMVAKAIEVTWNTAQIHLYRLLVEGKVRGKRVGRQNQWTVAG